MSMTSGYEVFNDTDGDDSRIIPLQRFMSDRKGDQNQQVEISAGVACVHFTFGRRPRIVGRRASPVTRYRLRLPEAEAMVDALLEFIRSAKNAAIRFPDRVEPEQPTQEA